MIPVIGSGQAKFQPMHVEDVARCIVTAIRRDDLKNQTLEIGGPEILTFEDIVDTIARTIYGEARGEPLEGKIAVAWTVVNRFRKGSWLSGRTLAATALKRKQYSCWNKGDPNREQIDNITAEDQMYQLCLWCALGVVLGLEPDPTGERLTTMQQK